MATIYTSTPPRAFFIARLRRLAPSFGIISVITLLISFVLVTPFQFKEISKETILGMTGTANLYFWNDDTYFSPERFRPLLHMWTLAVELQFYLLFPFFSKIARKIKSSWIVFATLSLTLSQVILYKSPKTSFFLLPTRFWEFALGVLACGFTQTFVLKPKTVRKALVILSLLGIISALFVRINPDSTIGLSGHPGIAAFLITSSTALLLSLNYNCRFSGSVFSKSLLSIGNASYAIYLIHFPFLVALNYHPFQPSSTYLDGLVSKTLAIFFAVTIGIVLTTKFEKPLLNRPFGGNKIFLGMLLLATICLSLIPINRELSSTNVQNISKSLEDRSVYRCGKIFRILNPNSRMCELFHASSPGKANVLLLGNSHADAIKSEVLRLAKKENINFFFWADNNPFTNSDHGLSTIATEIAKSKIDKVILHSSYGYPGKLEIEKLIRLTERQGTEFYMIESIPTYLDSVPVLEYRKSKGEKISYKTSVNPESIHISENYKKIDSPRFTYLPSRKMFCKEVCVWGNSEGGLYYFDSNHLTLTGARLLEPVLNQIKVAY
jgi:peptidoglycan/LPS O-acetylase OafA/YrhL